MKPFLFLTALAFSATGQGRPQQFVTVSNPLIVSIDNAKHVEVLIRNAADQPVTAWEVSIELSLADGSVRRPSFAADAYLTHAGVPFMNAGKEGALIPAHSVVRRTMPLQGSLDVQSMRASVEWVIFGDRSWLGNSTRVHEVFARRDADARASAFILASLRAGLAAAPGSDSLAVALDALDSRQQTDYDHPAKRVMRGNLQRAMERLGAEPSKARDVLRDLIIRTEAKLAAAEEHRQPRTKVPVK